MPKAGKVQHHSKLAQNKSTTRKMTDSAAIIPSDEYYKIRKPIPNWICWLFQLSEF